MIELSTYKPKDALVEEVLEAVRGRYVRGLWKRKIRAAGGELGETRLGAGLRTGAVLGVLTHPKTERFEGAMGRTLNAALGAAFGQAVHNRWGEFTKQMRDFAGGALVDAATGIRGRLLGEGARLLGKNDAAGVWRKGGDDERGLRVVEKWPKFVVVWPRNEGVAEGWNITTEVKKDKGANERPLFIRHSAEILASRMNFGAVGWWPWPAVGVGTAPSHLTLPAAVFSPAYSAATMPAMMMGVPGSGFVGVAFSPAVGMTAARQYEAAGFSLRRVAWWHASLIEILLAWAVKEEIDWGKMTEGDKTTVLEVLRWRKPGKVTGVVAAAPPKGTLDRFGVLVEDFSVSKQRKAILDGARLRREADVAEAAAKWKKTGKELGEELEELIRMGRIRAGYVTNDGQGVLLLLPSVRFTQAVERVVRDVKYQPGIYEMSDMWLQVPAQPTPSNVLALDVTGAKHPHPHVYADKGGRICWGRTETGAGAENERDYGEVVIDKLFTEGWGSFVDTINGFFSQWHDDPMYISPLACSRRISGLEDRK